MKKLEEMSLEELLEYDANHYVLTRKEFLNVKIYTITSSVMNLPTVMVPVFIHNLLFNLNIFNILSTGLIATNSIIAINNMIHSIQNQYFSKIYDTYRKNLSLRKELMRLYNTLLEDLVEEIKKSTIDKDQLTVAILVGQYLIPKGIVTYTKSFHRILTVKEWKIISSYDSNLSNNQENRQGIYIPMGYGCCRHYNSFISDILTKMNLKNEVLSCLICNSEEFNQRKKEVNYNANHVIIGYQKDNRYHLIDPYNNCYSFVKEKDYFYDMDKDVVLIPDFTETELWNQKNCIYHPDIPYQHFDKQKIIKIANKIENCLFLESERNHFIEFKMEHLELLKKIAYLVPLELERTAEKEKQKRKEYRHH